MKTENIKEKLHSEMKDMSFNENTLNAFTELAYTAAELGILQYRIRDTDIIALWKLAEKYGNPYNLPKEYIL